MNDNNIRHRGRIHNNELLFILHNDGVAVFTIRSLSRFVEYSYILQDTIIEVNTIENVFDEQQFAIDTGFKILSPAITSSGAIVTADTALTEEDISRHLGIISTLTGISLGYFPNNANIVYEVQIQTNAGVATLFPTISTSNAIGRVETVFKEEEVDKSLTFTSVFTDTQSGNIANTAFSVCRAQLQIYPRVTSEFSVTEAPYINAEFQTVFMEEDANRHLELKTVFTDITLGDVANNVAVNNGG